MRPPIPIAGDRAPRALVWTALLAVALTAKSAHAQVIVRPPPGPTSAARAHAQRGEREPSAIPASASRDLRGHFGIELASRLLHSNDPEDRLRGLERLASLRSPEAVSMLVHAARDAGARRVDSRSLLVIVRGLSDRVAIGEVRQFLKDTVLGSVGSHAGSSAAAEPETEGDGKEARLALARMAAALALASSGDAHAIDALLSVARDAGPGQSAAEAALSAFPPEKVATAVPIPMSPALLRLAASLGDLRALASVRAALGATSDPTTRAAALEALAALGDSSGAAEARALLQDSEPRVRVAAAGALVRLGTPDRFRAVEALLEDESTSREGLRLAAISADAGVVKALAAKAVASSDPEARSLAVFALGRSENPSAVQALTQLANDGLLAGDAAAALARSPSSDAEAALETMAGRPSSRRLAARAYVLRARTRDERRPWGEELLRSLAASTAPIDRSVGLSGLVLLGEVGALEALDDGEALVRRAVALSAQSDLSERTRRGLLARSTHEPDAVVFRLERVALVAGDPTGLVSTRTLEQSIEEAGSDAPLAALALASRGEADQREAVDALLASSDPILRAHAARGLAASQERDATGRLARAYTFEVDPLVRRAIVEALAARTLDRESPSRASVLRLAAKLDADAEVRRVASRAREGLAAEEIATTRRELTWLRVVDQTPGPSPALEGALLLADGIAVPIAFDGDGFALVPGPPGEARLLLTPRLPAYQGASR